MASFTDLLQQGAGHAWLFIPSAILLGVLHGLEPGHSKTMMAAFIVAIRGTVAQAVMLGLAATVSHTLVVWAVAMGGLYLGRQFDAETTEPYFQIASAVVIIAVATWMIWRTWRARPRERSLHAHAHSGHHHAHGHRHHDDHHHEDEHERAHAQEIQRHFADGRVTNWQILVFGLTGGLIPCPAAITVLLLCLQLKELALGATMVMAFSVGLAITLVAVGSMAALSVRHASRRWTWFATAARRAPYASGALIILVGIYVGVQGWLHLPPAPFS